MTSRKNNEIVEMYTIEEDDNISGKNFDTLTVTSTEINFTPR